jgi:ABC-2 type transport system permease protein
MTRFRALFHARNMEFLRDRGTLIWNIAFPVLLIFGFAFAFGGDGENIFTVGYVGERPTELEFFELDHVEFVAYEDLDAAVSKVRFHQIDLLIDVAQDAYFVNESSTNGYIARQLLAAMHGARFEQRTVTGRPIRYVDWFVPGLIGMNMMFSGIFGVGFVLVRYRKNGVLKRLKATPVSAFEFVSAQVASRFVIVVITSVVVFTATNLALGFVMQGSYLLLLVLTMFAVFCMISLGLIFATRITSEELASGLMNIVTLPMILVSGVFFSLEGSPPVLRAISRAFPLTHFVDGARAIMLDGAGVVQVAPHLLVLAGFTVAFLVVASLLFRWE